MHADLLVIAAIIGVDDARAALRLGRSVDGAATTLRPNVRVHAARTIERTPPMSERRYWIGVVSQDYVESAVAQGFVQLAYGRSAPLERMQPGDGLVFYSPRTSHPAGAPLQAFTAIGRVGDGPVYEADQSAPMFRRRAAYLSATPAPILPLLEQLSFIRNKTHWGAAFRFGVVRVPRDDFAAIALAMGRDPDIDFA
jgi:hypothetical protein